MQLLTLTLQISLSVTNNSCKNWDLDLSHSVLKNWIILNVSYDVCTYFVFPILKHLWPKSLTSYTLTMMVVHSYDELKIYIWRFSQNNEFNIILHTDFSFAFNSYLLIEHYSGGQKRVYIEKNDFKCIVIGLMTF